MLGKAQEVNSKKEPPKIDFQFQETATTKSIWEVLREQQETTDEENADDNSSDDETTAETETGSETEATPVPETAPPNVVGRR